MQAGGTLLLKALVALQPGPLGLLLGQLGSDPLLDAPVEPVPHGDLPRPSRATFIRRRHYHRVVALHGIRSDSAMCHAPVPFEAVRSREYNRTQGVCFPFEWAGIEPRSGASTPYC